MRHVEDIVEYAELYKIEVSRSEIEEIGEKYRFPLLLMHGFDTEGEIRFFIVTFDEALAVICAARPDKSGVKGMNTREIVELFERYDFRDQNGHRLIMCQEFRDLVGIAKGGTIPRA